MSTVAIGWSVFSYSIKPLALEMGGRNQKTQLLRSWWAGGGGAGTGAGWAATLPASLNEAMEAGLLSALPPKVPSLADFSAVGVFAGAPPSAASNGFPGDLGAFAAPNEAKAPEPRPKAVDAPPMGEAKLPPPGGVAELNECFPSDELSPPNRLKEGLRPEALSWPGPVERESLLEVLAGCYVRTGTGWEAAESGGKDSLGTATPYVIH